MRFGEFLSGRFLDGRNDALCRLNDLCWPDALGGDGRRLADHAHANGVAEDGNGNAEHVTPRVKVVSNSPAHARDGEEPAFVAPSLVC
jgi:hypothetical protein